MKRLIALSSMFLLLIACGDPENDESDQGSASLSKAEAAEKLSDNELDYDPCEEYGWYDDGQCDEFCPEPDPACDDLDIQNNEEQVIHDNDADNSTNGDEPPISNQSPNGDEPPNYGDESNDDPNQYENDDTPDPYECQYDDDCMVGGCSSHLCLAEDVQAGDTCEWLDEYACYDDSEITTCGCHEGTCAWAETEELDSCLDEADGDLNYDANDSEVDCMQVITYGTDPETGECKEFPTPCDVPDGWDASHEPCAEEDDDETGNECESSAECVTAGCSGTICQHQDAEDFATTCEWQEEYACYQDDDVTSCGCFEGSCGWDQTDELDQCLQGSM